MQPAFHAIPCDGSVEDDAMIALCWYLSFPWSGQNYLCAQSSVEDDAKEKGAMADHSFQASDVLHLQKKRFELI